MSSENSQQSFSNIDCFKLLDTLFQTDQSQVSMETVFNFFEENISQFLLFCKNFTLTFILFKILETQPIIIYKLVDYYFDYRIRNDHSADSSYAESEFFYSESSKSILDLLLTVPEELSHVPLKNFFFF